MRHNSLSPQIKHQTHSLQKRISLSQQMVKQRRPKSNSSDRQGYQMLLKTSYIMSNIKKSIKENDVKYLVGQKRVKLRTQPAQDSQWKQKTTHNALIDIRKRYDCVKRQRIMKLQQTQKIKERLKTFEIQQSVWRQKVKRGRSFSNQELKFFNEQCSSKQYECSDKQVFMHMCSRLKQDISFYKAGIIIAKRKLRSFQQNVKTLKTEQQKLTNQQRNSSNLLNRLVANLSQQNKQRQDHIYNLHQMIQNKLLEQQTQIARIQYEQMQAQKALLAKDNQQKNWQLLFTTHLFLKKILVNKMQKQMQKFKIVELAFKKIISRTEVKDVNDLTKRFLNKQKIYGQLLTSVAKTKQSLNELKIQQNLLMNQNNKLQQTNKQLLNVQYTLMVPKIYPKNSVQTIERANNISTTKKKLKQWLLRQLLKINRVEKNRYVFLKSFYQQEIQFLFKKYLEYINDLIIRKDLNYNIQQQNNQKQIQQQNIITLQLQTNLQNKSFISTHPKTKYQKTDRIQKNDKNDIKNSKLFGNWTIENQNYLHKLQLKQIQDENYKSQQETNLINLQRQQYIQTNDKFMRELRIRYRQSKQKKI